MELNNRLTQPKKVLTTAQAAYFVGIVLLALFSVGFLGRDGVIIIALGLLCIIAVFITGNSRLYNGQLLWLSLTFFVYYITILLNGVANFNFYSVSRWFLCPVCGYICGLVLTDGREKRAKTVLTVIATGNFIHGVLNLSISLLQLTANARYVNDIWTGNISSATLQSIYFTMAIGFSVGLLYGKKFINKMLGVLVIAVALSNALLTSTRTPLVMIAIILVAALLINKKISVLKRIGVIAVAGIIAIVIYNNDIFNVKTIFEQSNLADRLTADKFEEGFFSSIGRTERAMSVWESLIDHPFGNPELTYAHNLWLDVARLAGIIPFVMLIIYSVSTISTLVKFNRYTDCDEGTKKLFNLVYITVLVNFLTEPILEGVPFIFAAFCVLNGAVNSVLKHSEPEYLAKSWRNQSRLYDI